MVFLDRIFEKIKGTTRKGGVVSGIEGFTDDYEKLEGFNIVAAVSNKLANIVCSEAEIELDEAEDGRGDEHNEVVDAALRAFQADLRNVVSRTFGTGGVVLRPYVYNGAIYTDIARQEQFFVIEGYGGNIVKAGFIADYNDVRPECIRIELHRLADEGYVIENKAFEGEREIPLRSVQEWAGIEPVTILEGVKQPLFTHLKCPVDARGMCGAYGAPVTHGQDWLIKTIKELLAEIPLEYRNKRAFIGAEDLLFDATDRLPESGLYKLLRANGGDSRSFWEVFSPEIRHTSYFEGLNYMFGLLEKAISVNKGILTDLDSTDATATAIRRSMFDTYNLVDAMRRNIEKAVYELVYAFETLAAVPEGRMPEERRKIRFNWSYSLLEDSSETFKQLMESFKEGIVTKEEIRRFLF